MIRRLIVFRDIPDEDAKVATIAAAKMCDASLLVSFVASDKPGRLLLYDNVTVPGKKRRAQSRIIADPAEHSGKVRNEAMAAGEVVVNVFDASDHEEYCWPYTDALLTIAFPDGDAVCWFWRVNGGGTSATVAADCIYLQWRKDDAIHPDDWDWGALDLYVRSLFWPKKKLSNPDDARRYVLGYADFCLDSVPVLD